MGLIHVKHLEQCQTISTTENEMLSSLLALLAFKLYNNLRIYFSGIGVQKHFKRF